MLPSKTESKQEGNLGGEVVEMSLDSNSLVHIMDLLTDLYSDREKAVIRELSTNALDSHIAAGQTKPIEISTPTYLSFYFRVKDYGLGLSADDIRNIYSKYGASTKRTTNEQVGMLGIGCKSPLAYTDQFTITSVKDGLRIHVVVSRTDTGGGEMTILDESPTSEPNGVEIAVPVSRDNRFEQKTREFFQYWDSSTVLVNGNHPSRVAGTPINHRIMLKDNASFNSKSIVVMGGVPYEVDMNQVSLPSSLVAFVDIGEVDFQPSREYLKYTNKTKRALEALQQEYLDHVSITIQQDIDKAATKIDAILVFSNWANRLRRDKMSPDRNDFTYKSHILPTPFEPIAFWAPESSLRILTSRYDKISYQSLANSTIVYGYQSDVLTTTQRKKLREWAETETKSDRFYFFVDKPDSWWLEDVDQVAWKEILAVKLPSAARNTAGRGAYDCYVDGFKSLLTLDKQQPIFYSTKKDWQSVTESGIPDLFKHIQFVFVGANRLNKFLSKYPTAVPLKDGLHKFITDYMNSLTEEDLRLLGSSEYDLRQYQVLDKIIVRDPDLMRLLDLSKDIGAVTSKQNQWERLCQFGWRVNIHDMRAKINKSDVTLWVKDRYPILPQLLRYNSWEDSRPAGYWQHLQLYLDSAYKQYKELNNESTVLKVSE